eukprot:790836_1
MSSFIPMIDHLSTHQKCKHTNLKLCAANLDMDKNPKLCAATVGEESDKAKRKITKYCHKQTLLPLKNKASVEFWKGCIQIYGENVLNTLLCDSLTVNKIKTLTDYCAAYRRNGKKQTKNIRKRRRVSDDGDEDLSNANQQNPPKKRKIMKTLPIRNDNHNNKPSTHTHTHLEIAMKENVSPNSNAVNAPSFVIPCGIIKRNVEHESTNYDYLSIYTDKRCLLHCIPDTNVSDEFNERPARLQALLDMIDAEHWSKCCRFIPSLTTVPSLDDIEGLHSNEYLSDLRKSCSKIPSGNWNVPPKSDTYLVPQTFEAAVISAGLVVEATGHIFGDANDNAKYAVVLNRPPSHHCDGESYNGYCFINSIAVAIEKQLNEDTRVLVLDVDVHHGDGTQALFYDDPTVLTVSFHQYDGQFYPATGKRNEYGKRRTEAYGTNVNVPLKHGAGDLDVLYALRNMVWKIVEKFKPDIAFYAVGTDGVTGDQANASTVFTPNVFGQIAYELRKYVNLIVVTTEGGYTTNYLSTGMSAVLHGLTGQIDTEYYPSQLNENEHDDILAATVHTVAATKNDLRKVWGLERDPDEFAKIFN